MDDSTNKQVQIAANQTLSDLQNPGFTADLPKKKSKKLWIFLLVVPIPSLILAAILQIISRLSESDMVRVTINIFALLVGIGSVLMLLGFPVWIIMLVRKPKN